MMQLKDMPFSTKKEVIILKNKTKESGPNSFQKVKLEKKTTLFIDITTIKEVSNQSKEAELSDQVRLTNGYAVNQWEHLNKVIVSDISSDTSINTTQLCFKPLVDAGSPLKLLKSH